MLQKKQILPFQDYHAWHCQTNANILCPTCRIRWSKSSIVWTGSLNFPGRLTPWWFGQRTWTTQVVLRGTAPSWGCPSCGSRTPSSTRWAGTRPGWPGWPRWWPAGSGPRRSSPAAPGGWRACMFVGWPAPLSKRHPWHSLPGCQSLNLCPDCFVATYQLHEYVWLGHWVFVRKQVVVLSVVEIDGGSVHCMTVDENPCWRRRKQGKLGWEWFWEDKTWQQTILKGI